MASSLTNKAATVDHSRRPLSLKKQVALDTRKKKSLGPFFYKLPQELKFDIFGDCIASGHPQFMRASLALQSEGNAVISKGIYRMRLGQITDTGGQYPSSEVAMAIRNLDVFVDIPSRTSDYSMSSWDRLKPFELPNTPRGKCRIVVQADSVMDVISLSEIFYFVSCLKGFEEMLIHVMILRDQRDDLVGSVIESPAEHRFLELVGKSLFEQLGEGRVESKAYGFAWHFYRRKHPEKAASRAEEEP